MRALAAGLTVFLGLGAVGVLATTMAGCSDSTDAGGSGGAGGASGSTSTAGAGGSSAGAGGAACKFQSSACTTCLGANCTDQLTACSADTATCKPALDELTPCVCGGTDTDTCAGTFVTDGGTKANDLAECYTLNCMDSCQ